MAAEPNYAYSRIVVFQPCWKCQEEEQGKEQERASVFRGYTPRNFLNHSRPDMPCKGHCPDCQHLPQVDALHPNVCKKHWKEEMALVAGEGEGDSSPTIKEINRALPYRDMRAIREANERFFPPTGALTPEAVAQARHLQEARQASDEGTVLPPATGTGEPTPAPMMLPENAEVDENGWLTAIEDKEPPATLPSWLQEAAKPDVQVTALPANAAEVEKTPTQELFTGALAQKTISGPLPAVRRTAGGDTIIGAPPITGPMRLRYEGQKLLAEHCQRLLALKDDYLKLSVAAHQIVQDTETLLHFAPPDLQSALRTLIKHYAALSEEAQRIGDDFVPEFPMPTDPERVA